MASVDSRPPKQRPSFDFGPDDSLEDRIQGDDAMKQDSRADSIGRRIVVSLVSLATIVGGVAASVQVYDYFTKQPSKPPAPISKGIEVDRGSATQSIGKHFHANLPQGWIVADRESFESSVRMSSPDAGMLFDVPDYVIDRQYLVPSAPSEASPVIAGQLVLIQNAKGTTVDQMFDEIEQMRHGPQNGHLKRDGTARIESATKVETMSGQAIRLICSLSMPYEPDRIVAVSNMFYCPTKDRAWMAVFYSRVGDDVLAADLILPVVESLEVYD